ncbi:MAG TPA: NAD(P)H-dependent oxidoreductase subunit E, partial [Planctomycetia bacterium]|nr:NAD(P)H-dependent oxidoreductase subunit E [Planctomycetia bacterium]
MNAGSPKPAARSRRPTERPSIVQELKAILRRHGYLPKDELAALADTLGEPRHRIQEVVSTFPLFRDAGSPPPRLQIHVCRDMACHLAGAPACRQALDDFKA